MKVCPKCNKEKGFKEFHFSKSKKDGYNAYCKECSKRAANKYNRANIGLVKSRAKHERENVKVLVNSIKEKYGCSICGEKEGCCLDFHHPNSDKDGAVSNYTSSKNIDKLFEEINKCTIVCSNCHRKIHIKGLKLDKYSLCLEDVNNYFEQRNGRFYKRK